MLLETANSCPLTALIPLPLHISAGHSSASHVLSADLIPYLSQLVSAPGEQKSSSVLFTAVSLVPRAVPDAQLTYEFSIC